ncbi:hypothetical protein H310_04032 [Aphanomyces invadans]|uniref:Uncharacterized protein n=1 Tax=Aphanomyces invadans TaxID=157072 RepID=A0A024UH71_9STRA|nr:hypothetical protein H310_04032 [Aphanomyces invadans]ETW04933.1 hypothetical protein H310_04032 [Aphanomyces invadans]|eukprot:XP_008866371.1 hypothetical protein H310_04032 [Aphanomyces invadans]
MDPNSVVIRLQQELDNEHLNLDEMSQLYHDHAQQVEDANDSPTPILDSFFAQGGNASLTTMMNLTLAEFESIWAIVESTVVPSWTLGRGRKSPTSTKDAFYMTLVVLKHYNPWDKHALDFRMKAPTFEKMIHRMIDLVEPVLYGHYVQPVTMTQQIERDRTFSNFPSALYCTVKFQPSYRPMDDLMKPNTITPASTSFMA